MLNTLCGIDFGTTNSAISVINEKKCPKLISFNGKKTIPTAIYFPEDSSGKALFGTIAIQQYINGGTGRLMRSLKRILGTDLMNLKAEVNDIWISYQDIIYYYIKHLKNTAEEETKTVLDGVVLGRPVHFQDFSPNADKKAEHVLKTIAQRAGFKYVAFQYEPIAAAYAHERKLESEKLACVIDIGGGTSDFSIIRIGPKNSLKYDRSSDVIANTGIRIGGNDFDKDISIKCFMRDFGYGSMLKPEPYTKRILPVPSSYYVTLSEWSSINNLYTYKEKKSISQLLEKASEKEKLARMNEVVQKELGHTLLNKVEQSKIRLTTEIELSVSLDFLKDSHEIYLNKTNLETAITLTTEKIVKSLEECIKQAKVTRENVEVIILTGGTTEIPFVKNSIIKLFPNAIISEDNKLSSVATGLSYDVMNRFA